MDILDYQLAMAVLNEIQEAIKPASQMMVFNGISSFSFLHGDRRIERMHSDRGKSISGPTKLISVRFQLYNEDHQIDGNAITLDLFREEGFHRCGTCTGMTLSGEVVTDERLEGLDWKQAICHFLRVVSEKAVKPTRHVPNAEDLEPILSKFL